MRRECGAVGPRYVSESALDIDVEHLNLELSHGNA